MIYNASILSKIQGTLKCTPAWYRYFFKLSTFLTFPFLMFPKCFSYKYNRQRMESEISLEPDWTQLRHWPICNRLSIRNISLHVCTLYTVQALLSMKHIYGRLHSEIFANCLQSCGTVAEKKNQSQCSWNSVTRNTENLI